MGRIIILIFALFIYHKQDEYNVCSMLTHLFLAVENQFREAIVVKLLGNKQEQMNQIQKKCMENSYASACAQNIMQQSNPQDDIMNAPPKIKFNSHFGKNESRDHNKNCSINKNSGTKTNSGNNKIFKKNEKQLNIIKELKEELNRLRETQTQQSQTILDLN